MSILKKQKKTFDLIQVELEQFGFNEFNYRPHNYLLDAKKNIGELTYLLRVHLAKGISLSFVRGHIMVNPVNKILNQFIPDLSRNNEFITLKNHKNGGTQDDFEKINRHVKNVDIGVYITAIMEHIKKIDFPFFAQYPTLETINQEIINKVPHDDYNKWFPGKLNFKVLTIMKLCSNPNYDAFKNWALSAYKKGVEIDHDYYINDFNNLNTLLALLDSGNYLKIIESDNII